MINISSWKVQHEFPNRYEVLPGVYKQANTTYTILCH